MTEKPIYITFLKDVRVAKTFIVKEGLNLDISEDGHVIGLELL